jgi:hypothetical protein
MRVFEKEMKALDNKQNQVSRPVPKVKRCCENVLQVLLVNFIN